MQLHPMSLQAQLTDCLIYKRHVSALDRKSVRSVRPDMAAAAFWSFHASSRILCCVQCSNEANLPGVKIGFCLRHVLGSSAGPVHLYSAPFHVHCILVMHGIQHHVCTRYSFSNQAGLCGVA